MLTQECLRYNQLLRQRDTEEKQEVEDEAWSDAEDVEEDDKPKPGKSQQLFSKLRTAVSVGAALRRGVKKPEPHAADEPRRRSQQSSGEDLDDKPRPTLRSNMTLVRSIARLNTNA